VDGQTFHKTAIVTVSEASVRNGPFDESPSAFTARDGAELRVLDHKDDWLQVTDGTRRVGWVKRDAALVSPEFLILIVILFLISVRREDYD